MATYPLAVLLFALAVATASPTPSEWFDWPDQPTWWPNSLAWPPANPQDWSETAWPPQSPDGIQSAYNSIFPYIPSRDNQFHLLTRANPSISQPLVFQDENLLAASNYNSSKRTVVIIHDYQGSVLSPHNAVLVPAFLAADDLNVILVDWSAGADHSRAISYFYSVLSGNFVARFLRWLSATTSGNQLDYHLVGVGLGGINAGIIGWRLGGRVGYVTVLDPIRGSDMSQYMEPINPYVAQYSEVIHTDGFRDGHVQNIGDVDFYPNGGYDMPGCACDSTCNRMRAVYYYAESLQSGGFSGVECNHYREAINHDCSGEGRAKMGGLLPKIGLSGIFYLETNAQPPFSKD